MPINICAEGPVDECGSSSISVSHVGNYYQSLIDFWISKEDANLRVREIENFALGILGLRTKNCSFNGTCGNYICIDFNGIVYPCDRFSSNDAFVLGDLTRQSLQQIIEGVEAIEFKKFAELRSKDCLKCKWLCSCNNGCTAMRGKISGKYLFCDARKVAFEYLGKTVSN